MKEFLDAGEADEELIGMGDRRGEEAAHRRLRVGDARKSGTFGLRDGRVRVCGGGRMTTVEEKESVVEKALKQADAMLAGTFRRRQIKRNDSCPCGSGQKYKKCCMRKLNR